MQPQTSQPTRQVLAASVCPFGQIGGAASTDTLEISHTCSIGAIVGLVGQEAEGSRHRSSDIHN